MKITWNSWQKFLYILGNGFFIIVSWRFCTCTVLSLKLSQLLNSSAVKWLRCWGKRSPKSKPANWSQLAKFNLWMCVHLSKKCSASEIRIFAMIADLEKHFMHLFSTSQTAGKANLVQPWRLILRSLDGSKLSKRSSVRVSGHFETIASNKDSPTAVATTGKACSCLFSSW